MTDAYRQKLLNWLCSMSVIFLITAIVANLGWFIDVPQAVRDGVWDTWYVSAILANVAIYFISFSALAVWWHFFEAIERRPPRARLAAWITRYLAFLGAIVILGVFVVATAAGLGWYNSCDVLEGALHTSCLIGLYDWIEIPFMIATVLALLLCIVKAVWSLWSLIKKPE